MQHRFNILKPLGISLICIALLVFTSLAHAARVTQVKGKKVLIDFTGSDVTVNEGARYVVVIDGKRKGIVQITKVKGTKAIGELTKGRAAVDATLVASGKAKKSRDQESAGDESTTAKTASNDAMFIGGLLGYSMNSQSGSDGAGGTFAMSGSAITFRAFGDLPLSSSIGMIGRFGIENFNVTQSAASGTYETKVMYLATDLLLRYSFGTSGFVPYASGGMGIYFPLSKSSNRIRENSIATNSVFYVGGGFNWFMSDTFMITTSLEYGIFPPINIQTSIIGLRSGVAFAF